MLALSVGADDSRHSLPTDPVSDPTPVAQMVGGANRVCLRPGRPETDSWLAGPQCFEDGVRMYMYRYTVHVCLYM